MTCIKRCSGPQRPSSLGKAVGLSLLFTAVSAVCPSTTEAGSHPTRTFVLHDHGISISVPSYWHVGEPYERELPYVKGITVQRIDFIDPSDDVFPLKSGCTLHHISLQSLGIVSLYAAKDLAPLIAGRIDEPDTEELITIKREDRRGAAYYERSERFIPGIWHEAWLFFDHFDLSGTTLHALTCVYKDTSVSRLHENAFNSIVFLSPSWP